MNFFLKPSNCIVSIVFFFLIILSHQSSFAQQLAFPSATGAGAYTTGGRGGIVVHVTNLNSSGPGSFAAALLMTVPRTIVFDVSGVISIDKLLYVGEVNSNFTIAGQTAPEGGITIVGGRVYFSSVTNYIMRHIRFKGGWQADWTPNSGDNLGSASFVAVGNINESIVDHVSFGFAPTMPTWVKQGNKPGIVDKTTIQKSLFSESVKGAIIGQDVDNAPYYLSGDMTFSKNIFYNTRYRTPNTTGNHGPGNSFDIINNLTWQAQGRMTRSSGDTNINQLNNATYHGSSPLTDQNLNLYSEGWKPKIYAKGNLIVAPNIRHQSLTNTLAEMNADNTLSWKYFVGSRYGTQLPDEFFTDTPFSIKGEPQVILNASDLRLILPEDSGCNARLNADGSVSPNLDTHDAEYLENIKNNIMVKPLDVYKLDPIPSVSRPANFYVNNPHIPEIWFAANVPEGQDHNDIAPSGYTWLEEYLNGVDRPRNAVAIEDVEVSPDPAELKIAETLQLTKMVTPENATNQHGTWTSSDEAIATVDTNGLVTAVSVGKVTITFTSADGGKEGKSEITVFPEALQASAGTDQQICEGATTTLTASGGTNYVWSTGETTESIEVSPETTTIYKVTVSDDDGQSDEASVTVTVNSIPIANAGEDQTICYGETATLTATGGASYLWSTGETTASIEVNPTEDTVYSVEVSNNGCSSADEMSVFVKEVPELTISGDLIISEGESTTLTVSGGDNYEWDTGEITESITVSPEVTTTYTVSSNNPNGCSSFAEITVVVAHQVSADAGQDVDICEGTSTTLMATGGTTYLWSTGETSESIEVNPNATTTYSVTVFDSTGTNSDTDDVIVTVNPRPTVDAGSGSTIDSGESVILTATGATSYKWNTGETGASITVSPKATRTYTVTGTSNGCEATDTVRVTVTNTVEVIADAGADQNICAGSSGTLTASGGSTYLWSTGETTESIEVSPNATTTYKVTAYDSTGEFSDSDEVKVTVNPLPTVDAGSNVTINSGESTTLTATGASTYKWNTGETGASIKVSPTATTTYTVIGISNGCEATTSVKVTVVAPQVVVARAGGNKDICEGSEVTLTATGGDSYLWSTGAKTASIKVNPKSTTKYTVTAYIGNASATDDAIVNVSPKPNVRIINGSEAAILEGEFITLSATGANQYKWSNGAIQPNIAVRPTKTTSYEVVGYINDCSSQRSIKVNVFEKIVADAGDDVSICPNESTILTAKGPANSEFLWSTGETTKSITVSPDEDTEYSVMVFHDLDSDTDNVMVQVGNCENSQIVDDNVIIEDEVALEFLIHPNPTYGEVHIKISGLSTVSSIHLYDLSGKSLYNEAISVNDRQDYNKTLNLSDFASGIYLLQLVDNQRVVTKKIVLR